MGMKIKGVDYDDGLVAGVTISGVFDPDKDEPVTAYFRRQVYGKWINEGMGDFRCSICRYIGSATILNNYCPNCGAEMLSED